MRLSGALVGTRIDRSGLDFYPTVIVNRSVVLECVTTGIPKPEITWLKDGRALELGQVGAGRVRLLDDGAELSIQSAIVDDSSTYECRAENDAGQDRIHYQLKVLGMCTAIR